MIEVTFLPETIPVSSIAPGVITQGFPASHEIGQAALFTDPDEKVNVIGHKQ
jgi:hypothetical protein